MTTKKKTTTKDEPKVNPSNKPTGDSHDPNTAIRDLCAQNKGVVIAKVHGFGGKGSSFGKTADGRYIVGATIQLKDGRLVDDLVISAVQDVAEGTLVRFTSKNGKMPLAEEVK